MRAPISMYHNKLQLKHPSARNKYRLSIKKINTLGNLFGHSYRFDCKIIDKVYFSKYCFIAFEAAFLPQPNNQ